MAQLLELVQAQNNEYLRQRLVAAVAVQAETVRTEPSGTVNHVNRLLWAERAFSDPHAMAQRMIWAVLAQNRAASLQQIISARDEDVIAAVGAAINVFATG